MPLVEVFGFENHYEKKVDARLENFNNKIRAAIAETKGLSVTEKQVTVVHSGDVSNRKELIVIIRGLFVRSERTQKVKQEACNRVRENILTFGHIARITNGIEVWTEPLDTTKEGFAVYKK